MFYLARPTILFFVFVWCAVGYTADHSEHGPYGTLNWDYFTANQTFETKRLLNQVNQNHMDRSSLNSKGVLGLVSENRYKDAKGELDYALGRFPNYPRALMLLGMVAKLAKEPSWPIAYYEKALKLFPQYAVTHAQYGNYLVDIKQMEPGIAKLRDAIQIDPNLVVGHVWLARAYYQAGNAELGRQAAEKARELGYKGEISTGPGDKK